MKQSIYILKYVFVLVLLSLYSFTAKAVTTADAGTDRDVCKNSTDTIQLHANAAAAGETGTWSISFGNSGSGTFSDVNDPNATVTGIAEGTNTYTWTLDDGSAWGGTSSDDVTYTNNYREPNAGADDNVCGDTYNLNADDPSPNTGTWTGSAGVSFDDDSDPNAEVSNLSSGDNTLVWTIHECNGSDVTDQVIITNDFIEAQAGADQIVCMNEAILSANTPSAGQGTWSGPLGVSFDDSHDPNTTVHNLSHGNTTLTWEIDNNGCTDDDDVVINNDAATQSDAGNNQDLCSDQTVLHANNPTYGTGLWSLASGTVTFWDDTDRNTNASNLSFGLNQLVWTISTANCESKDTVDITNNLLIAYAGEDVASCNDTVQLNANDASPGIGEWTTSTLVTFDDDSQYNTIARNLSTNGSKLFWEITYSGCTSKDSVIVRMKNGTPIANAGNDQTLCANNTILTATLESGEIGHWETISGFGVYDNTDSPTSAIENLNQGNNTLRWIVENNGCFDQDEVIITNNLPDAPDAGLDQTLCSDNTILEANTISIGSGEWSVYSGAVNFDDTSNPSANITSIQAGTNQLIWTSSKASCVLTDTVNIINDLPYPLNAGTNQTICADNYSTLAASNPIVGMGQWSVVSGSAIFSDINSNTASVNDLDQGENTLRWTITNNTCVLSTDIIITNNLPDMPFAGYNQSVCSDSTHLQADALNIGAGLWTVNSGNAYFADNTNAESFIDSLAQGDNILVFTATNQACSLSDTVIITNDKPSIPNAGIDSTICADNYLLSASIPTIGAGEWSVVTGNAVITNVTANNAQVQSLEQGSNILRWTFTNNACSLSDDVIITNDLPDVPNAGEDLITCNNSAQLNATIPQIGTGVWSDNAGNISFGDSTLNNTAVNNIPRGINYLTWTITNNNCSLSDALVLKSSQLAISHINTDLSCFESNDGSIDLTLTGGFVDYSYTWYNENGLLSYQTEDLNTISAGTYYVVGTDVNNCSIADTIIVNQPTEIMANAVLQNILCHDDSTGSINIFANGGAGNYSYYWTVADSSHYNVTDSIESHLNNLISGVYSVKITDSTNCFINESFNIIEPTQISLSADVTNNVCYNGYDGAIDLTVQGGTPAYIGYNYSWTEQNDSIVSHYDSPFASADEDLNKIHAGTFRVIVTDQNNCKMVGTYQVSEPFAGMELSANITDVTCKDQHDGAIDIAVDNGTGPFFYNWSNNESTEDIEKLDGGIYNVTVTDIYNCVLTDSFTVNIINIACIHIYNVFSPNGDGVNDTWDIDNIDLYPEVEINVFNQWGNKVFESTGYSEPWDGTFDGSVLPAATYYYTLDLKNGDAPYSGSITILK